MLLDLYRTTKEHRKCDVHRLAAKPGIEPLGEIQGSRHGVESFVGAYTHKRSAGVGGTQDERGHAAGMLADNFLFFSGLGFPKCLVKNGGTTNDLRVVDFLKVTCKFCN